MRNPESMSEATRLRNSGRILVDAHGKLTDRPRTCFVTRAPGVTHASNGVHGAREDSTPMILFVVVTGQTIAADGGVTLGS
ncbi:hypothetical protein DX980_29045 [Burkholderia gladioli]|jgi:thiamine pyrophosphate-dependent acetolactate synthase large subunit-like protein|nr:hypothetical protein CEJ98_31190 [Burkholderia gladioli pv. gladioli]AWY50764.1 hypothetical protein A8H28_05960 [Burkholderia gladioli pv. gladioli]PRG58655.1 hypothetical protein C6V06_00590 [Burkholderia gladioli]PRH03220.1 hypothetical protein C6V08_11955 [Burkholderia gladioli]WAG23245.1 hypothetical protein DX980_29045 [Burkholderia gladioli]